MMLNNDVEIGEIQENRIWIHSKKRQFGKWIDSSKLVDLVLEQKTE